MFGPGWIGSDGRGPVDLCCFAAVVAYRRATRNRPPRPPSSAAGSRYLRRDIGAPLTALDDHGRVARRGARAAGFGDPGSLDGYSRPRADGCRARTRWVAVRRRDRPQLDHRCGVAAEVRPRRLTAMDALVGAVATRQHEPARRRPGERRYGVSDGCRRWTVRGPGLVRAGVQAGR